MDRVTSKKNRCVFTVIFLSVLFALISIFGFNGMIAAKADEDDDYDWETSGLPPTVYYFSDYAGSNFIYGELVSRFGSNNVHYDCRIGDNPKDYLYYLLYDFENNRYDVRDIRNAFVVLEIRTPFEPETVGNDPGAYEYLQRFISAVKGNSCRFIFINGTDESRFVGFDDIMDKVDFHINTDLKLTFQENIMYSIAYKLETPKISNCTFILDKGTVVGNSLQDKRNSLFIGRYFIPYFKLVYEDEYKNNPEYEKFQEFLTFKKISALCQISGTLYVDAITGDYVDLEEEISVSKYMDSVDFVVPIGDNSYQSEEEADEWLNSIDRLLTAYGKEDTIFIYNGANYDYNADIKSRICTCSGVDDVEIVEQLVEFINDRRSYTSNWSGRCEATYKSVKFGENGWMYDLHNGNYGDESLVINLPLFFDISDLIEYIYGTEDLWW